MKPRLVNGTCESWDFGHNQRIEKFVEYELITSNGIELTNVIEIGGLLFKHEITGDYLYDLLLESYDNKKPTKVRKLRIVEKIKALVHNVPIYDFIVEMRNIISNQDVYGNHVLSSLMRTAGIIVKAYNMGRVEGVVSSKNKVVMTNAIDHLDLSLIFLVEINSRPNLIKKLVTPEQRLYPADCKRFARYYRDRDFSNLSGQINSLDDNGLIELANNSMVSMSYAYITNFFNEVDNYFYPDYDYLATAGWEREETGNPKSNMILYFKFLVQNLLEKDCLRHRKFYIREKGVRIVFHKPIDDIKSIEIREVHLDNKYDEHYINYVYTLSSGETRMYYMCMKDLDKAEIPLLYEKDVTAFLMVLSWLGIINDFSTTPEKIMKAIGDRNPGVTYKQYVEVSKGMNKWLDHFASVMNKDNYYYETPTNWNYDSLGNGSNQGLKLDKPVRIIKVGRYTRKLPVGQNPSQEALALAKKFYIELKEGYTIVDEFEKLQRYNR